MRVFAKGVVTVEIQVELSQPWDGKDSFENIHKSAERTIIELVDRSLIMKSRCDSGTQYVSACNVKQVSLVVVK